ncbi:MAG: Mur ligase family protein [Candidatus Paceibacterota bacterium]|jgi:UDP-N-acetylmuramoyl-tripeptide--D-alanyl-D-alanine ligase
MLKQIFKIVITASLLILARLVLRKYKPRIIAITGSVGKTSTKDAVYGVLSKFFFVRKSEKSFNSEIGIPLSILGCPNAWNNPLIWIKNILDSLSLIINRKPYPAWLVLEVGSDRPGDIKKLTEWLLPDMNIITALPKIPVHVEYFSSPEAVNEEDTALADVVKHDGFLVLNHDDPEVLAVKSKTKARVVTYGFTEGATLLGSHPLVLYEGEGKNKKPVGVTFKVDYDGNSVPVRIRGVLGRNPMYSGLAALAAGKALGLNMITMIESLSSYETPPGRLRLIDGVKNTLLIDDTYNASPAATETALNAIDELVIKGRKIAVLGDMLELGKYSTEEHLRIGEIAGKVCDILITVGIRARRIAEGALISEMDEDNIFQFENSREAGKYLEEIIKPGDVALLKGSQSTRMEYAVLEVMLHPEDKGKLLCRQDEEWGKR